MREGPPSAGCQSGSYSPFILYRKGSARKVERQNPTDQGFFQEHVVTVDEVDMTDTMACQAHFSVTTKAARKSLRFNAGFNL